MTKKTKKDGDTKQKNQQAGSNPKHKTSSSANGTNGYH